MRWRSTLLLPLSLLSCVVAGPPPKIKDAVDDTPTDVLGKDEGPPGTVFNGQPVPAMADLNGGTIAQHTSKGYWIVEAFSPYCHHCKSLAPKWQTLYEFYYTSDPVPASQEPVDSEISLNSFTRYYNFKFAKLDCVAFGTACNELDVRSFPTLVLLKDGKEIKRSVGDKSMKELSDFLEESLETIRPGSRRAEGVELPKVGATESKQLATAKLVEKGKPNQETLERSTQDRMKPSQSPNPKGLSVSFTSDMFREQVTRSLDAWFIKFYAPWCPHCQAMAPNWSAMARDMKGRLNVGEVDCTVEKKLCKELHVQGYPTMMVLKGPERVLYEGLRGLGDLIDYAEKTVDASNGVQEVNAKDFEELEKKEEVLFIYFYDHATTSEDFEALQRLPLGVIGHAKVVKTNDTALVKRYRVTTWPRLIVSRDGRPTVFEGLSPADMRDVPRLSRWMESVWQPLVPELTAGNARELMSRKFVVLGVLSRERADEFAIAKREIKNAAVEWMEKQAQAYQLERQELRDAKQLRIEEAEDRNDQRALRNAKQIRINMDDIERKEVAFAWVDGVFWERWIRTTFGISVKDGEKVIIMDEDNRRYWDKTITGNSIVPSRTSILETLPKVVTNPPRLTPKATGSRMYNFFFHLENFCTAHRWVVAGMLVGILICVVASWIRLRRRRSFGVNTGGFFQLDDKGGLLGNGSPNGKVD